MKKLLVTGANGFIGNHFCDHIRKKGIFTVGLGRSKESRSCADDYLCCDLAHDDVMRLVSGSGHSFDAVVHLATDSRKGEFATESIAANCVGTQRLLDMCRDLKISTFVQLSSLPVIGRPVIHPITEEHPLAPPTIYHTTKVTQEFLAAYAEKTDGIRTVSFRLASPVGKNMNPKTIFSVFLRQALAGETMTVFGKGTRKQTYIYVDDVTEAIYRALVTNVHGVFNLTSSVLVSNSELAGKIKSVTGSSSEIIFAGDDPMDEFVWDTDISKMKNELGFVPECTSVEEMIRRMIQK